MTNPPVVHLCVSCDTDPDFNPEFRETPANGCRSNIWQGVLRGIPKLRRELSEAGFILPLTWLLRADRQIREIYDDPSYCFQSFESTWKSEQGHGSEIGWHPHLYRWDNRAGYWAEYLRQDDDLEALAECLKILRRHTSITAVRTGWTYHSNKLLKFFEEQRLLVDTSAISGAVQSGSWSFDWRGAPRNPYLPSVTDYRRPAENGEASLDIIEMPVLVRSLSFVPQAMRYCVRTIRSVRSPHINLTDWESSRYQGVMISGRYHPFRRAVEQIFSVGAGQEKLFLSTYFHADELLLPDCRANLISNLRTVSWLAERAGYAVKPTTVTAAAAVARDQLLRTGALQ